MNKIAVYCEMNLRNYTLADVSYELISKAAELKKEAKKIDVKDNDFEIVAIATGKNLDKDSVKKAIAAGADWVVLVKNEVLDIFSQTVFAQAFVEYFTSNPSQIILFPATPEGRIVAPRITTLLDTGLVADCTGLELIEKNGEIKLASTRPTFGAELMATILSKKNPQCATIRPKIFKAEFSDVEEDISDKYFEYELKYPPTETRAKLLRSLLDKDENAADFSNAKIILAGGYGLYTGKNREYFEKLEKLASLVRAKVGASRKITDMELLPRGCQIGQTGSTVCAYLYVAFGISGAIQHVSGMKNCKKIIAINLDENAEIFKYADYKIVADAKKIIDELIEHLAS